jgi:hypothetical protein
MDDFDRMSVLQSEILLLKNIERSRAPRSLAAQMAELRQIELDVLKQTYNEVDET